MSAVRYAQPINNTCFGRSGTCFFFVRTPPYPDTIGLLHATILRVFSGLVTKSFEGKLLHRNDFIEIHYDGLSYRGKVFGTFWPGLHELAALRMEKVQRLVCSAHLI